MSLKTLSTVAAAVLASTAMAGGAHQFAAAHNAAPMASNSFSPSAYVDVNGGWNYTNIQKSASFNGTSFKHSGNPWTFGADAGYMFMPHLAVELGGNYNMKIKATNGGDFKSYDIYAGLKMPVQIMDNLDLFGKVGFDYASVKNEYISTHGTANAMGPTFGAGVDYTFMPNWRASFQWRRVAGVQAQKEAAKLGGNQFPSQDLFTLGVGYVFPMS